jgi:hypothetical protein
LPCPDLGDVLAFVEPVRERVEAGLADPLELLATVAENV